MIKRTVTNVLLLSIVFAVIFGIVLYSISSYLMIVGFDTRNSIALGTFMSMTVTMTALRLTVIKMGGIEK